MKAPIVFILWLLVEKIKGGLFCDIKFCITFIFHKTQVNEWIDVLHKITIIAWKEKFIERERRKSTHSTATRWIEITVEEK